MRRKKNLDHLLPEETKKKASTTVTSELLSRVEMISNLAEEFFANVKKKVDEVETRISNLEEDIEQVIEALMRFEGQISPSPSGKGGASTSPKTPAIGPPKTPTVGTPTPPTPASTPATATATPGGGPPNIGGAPKIKVQQGANAPKF